MTDAPFEPRRLIRDLPELLAGKEPVLGSAPAYAYLRQDPDARGMLVAAMEIGSALEGGVAAVRWRGRSIPTRVRRPIERAHRFFRRRIAEVGLNVGFTRYIEQREDDWVYFENADAARPVQGDESESLRRAHGDLAHSSLDDEQRAVLAAIDTNDPKRIFPLCRELDPGSSIAEYYTLLVDPVRSLDPEEWLDLARRARDTETIGWALFQGSASYQVPSGTAEAKKLVREARGFLPRSVIVCFAALVYAIRSSDEQGAIRAAHDLWAYRPLDQGLVQHAMLMQTLCDEDVETGSPTAQVVAALPPDLRSALMRG
ncbi:MAG: hypothetical protein ACF8XB_06370 [Planctomycetota bacterium JB042]